MKASQRKKKTELFLQLQAFISSSFSSFSVFFSQLLAVSDCFPCALWSCVARLEMSKSRSSKWSYLEESNGFEIRYFFHYWTNIIQRSKLSNIYNNYCSSTLLWNDLEFIFCKAFLHTLYSILPSASHWSGLQLEDFHYSSALLTEWMNELIH